jgi:hypothetical protein
MSLIAILAGTKRAKFPHYLTGRRVFKTAFTSNKSKEQNHDDWYDASSDHMNHSELVDAFGDYKGSTAELEVSSANT